MFLVNVDRIVVPHTKLCRFVTIILEGLRFCNINSATVFT